MDTWFTSDTHIGHRSVLFLGDGRPWDFIREHDEALVERWNEVVKPNDIVYHLGDVSYRAQASYVTPFLSRLNGKVHLILGNHDKLIRKGHCVERFESIQTELILNYDKKRRYFLYHYPIEEWYGYFRGVVHLHGHTHKPEKVTAKNRINVATNAHNFYPVSIDEIDELIEEKKEDQ